MLNCFSLFSTDVYTSEYTLSLLPSLAICTMLYSIKTFLILFIFVIKFILNHKVVSIFIFQYLLRRLFFLKIFLVNSFCLYLSCPYTSRAFYYYYFYYYYYYFTIGSSAICSLCGFVGARCRAFIMFFFFQCVDPVEHFDHIVCERGTSCSSLGWFVARVLSDIVCLRFLSMSFVKWHGKEAQTNNVRLNYMCMWLPFDILCAI